MEITIMENQMEKNMENEMETGIIRYFTISEPSQPNIPTPASQEPRKLASEFGDICI